MSSNVDASRLPAPLNILDEKVFDEDWSIASKHGTPIIVWKDNCYGADECAPTISAWIDIIGFRNESIINNTRYVNGTPRSFAIVKRGAQYHLPGDMVFISFDSTSAVVDYNWDSGINTTEATQRTEFRYKEWIHYEIPGFGEFGFWCEYTDIFHVSYMADSPETFDNSIDDYEITITSYNNSVTPYTLIYAPPRENIIKQSVYYRNNASSWYNLTGLVKKNNRGTEHVRFLNETGFTIDENKTITRRAGYFVINEAPLNWSLLDISVFTPYTEKTDSVCNTTIYNSKPSDFVALKSIMIFLGILASFLVGIGIAIRRT